MLKHIKNVLRSPNYKTLTTMIAQRKNATKNARLVQLLTK